MGSGPDGGADEDWIAPTKGPFNTPFRELEKLRPVLPRLEVVPIAPAKPATRPLDVPSPLPLPAPSTPVARSSAAPVEDPANAFRVAVAGVQPLPRDRRGRVVGAPPPRPARGPACRENPKVSATIEQGGGELEVNLVDEQMEGLAPGVDRRLLLELRRGEHAVEAHVDLHGLTRDAAHDRVERFFADAVARSIRCVLVIHGRGLGSLDGVPVLKTELCGWLSRGRIARAVLAFSTAQPRDGGPGATYVLLRTARVRSRR